jgi:hypothetical protein
MMMMVRCEDSGNLSVCLDRQSRDKKESFGRMEHLLVGVWWSSQSQGMMCLDVFIQIATTTNQSKHHKRSSMFLIFENNRPFAHAAEASLRYCDNVETYATF